MLVIALFAVSLLAAGQQAPATSQANPPAPQATMGQGTTSGTVGIVSPNDVKWGNAPDSLPRGAQVAVLEGDPDKPGPFTIRIKMPADYRIAPHSHPNLEHITVIYGTLHVGMGDHFEQAAATGLPAGGFSYMQPGMHHFAWAEGETVIQLHGMGPWGINYVNPSDDPRRAGK